MNKLASLALNEEGFVFDPATGNSFTTNSIGLAIIQHLKDGNDSVEIIPSLVDEFAADFDTVQRDVLDFMAQLRMYHLFSKN